MNWHLDWTHVFSGVALMVITWGFRKMLAICKKGVEVLKSLASVADVRKAIDESNEKQLDRLRREGLLNGVYVRNDEKFSALVDNVRRLIHAKEHRGNGDEPHSKTTEENFIDG